MKINFYNLDDIEDSLLRYAVIVSNYNGKWIYCKHKERDTWEVPGGRREDNENILETAKRELFEETGAIDFDLRPIGIYSVMRDTDESYALLCYAKIKDLGKLPDMEIEKIDFFECEPKNLTYPDMQPKLFEKVRSIINSKF